jgi:riboflavin kinase/FMN adenylyltransferase
MRILPIKLQKLNHFRTSLSPALLILQADYPTMHIHRGYEDLNLVRPVVTLGIFDGVHLGHKILLERLVKKAREIEGEAVVITFSPHPRMILEKDNSGLTFLSTMEEKISLLENEGIEHLIIIEFTREFSRIPACRFVRDILVKKIGTVHLIIGYDHHFGKKGEGDFDTVRKCTETMALEVEQLEGLFTNGVAISSSALREALLQGRVEEAEHMLGYGYSLTGKVVEGKKIGRSLGFPTANIEPSDIHKLIPFRGVYAVEVAAGGRTFLGILSIGSNPTVNDDSGVISIEVHIIDFGENLYGSEITVIFRKRLRDEIKFNSVSELTEQMEMDKRSAIRFLS